MEERSESEKGERAKSEAVTVVAVQGSLKCGIHAELSPRTLLLGNCSSGKSALVNAVELALSGRASDVAGRAVLAKDAELWQLAPPGATEVFAQVLLSNGETARWSLTKGHRALRTGPAGDFPLRAVREALLGSPETARKWMVQQGGSPPWGAVLDLVPKNLHARLSSLRGGGAAAADLPTVLAAARGRARDAVAQAKAARALGKEVAPPRAGDAQADLEREIASASERRRYALARAQEAEGTLGSLPAQSAGTEQALETARSALAVADSLVARGARECFCGAKLDLEKLAERASRARARLDEALSAESRRRELAAALALARAEVIACESEGERLLAERKRLAQVVETSRGDTQRRHEERALEAEREGHEWESLADALASALGALVERSRLAFEARVQRFLPGSDVFGLDLKDGEREVLRVGLRRESASGAALISALGGAEWARVTAALALASAGPVNPGSCGPSVIIPEDRAWDPSTLAEALRALGSANLASSQVLVASTVEPREMPPGWTVVRL
jgi:hypothetical protein